LELLARLRVAVRHRDVLASTVDTTVVRIGDLRVDTGARVAMAGVTPLALSRKEFDVLALLVRHGGRVVTQGALLVGVWRTNDPAKTETLRVHVNQLRRKLGEGDNRPRIENVPGVGYRIVESDAEAS